MRVHISYYNAKYSVRPMCVGHFNKDYRPFFSYDYYLCLFSVGATPLILGGGEGGDR